MSDNQKPDTYILFELAETNYAVNSQDVQQLEMVDEFTPVPNAPDFVEGVVFLRGQVIPVINLRARFRFEKRPFDQRTRLVVIRDTERVVGFIVDTAREFVTIPAEAIQLPPESVAGMSGRYLDGIATLGNRMILLLNVAEVLKAAEEIELEEIEIEKEGVVS